MPPHVLGRLSDERAARQTPPPFDADDAVSMLEGLSPGDPEGTHREAERVLCRMLAAAGYGRVAEAFYKAKDRCKFWYA